MPKPPRKGPTAPSAGRPEETPAQERRSRAIDEPLELKVQQTRPYLMLEVRNPLHGTRYRVHVPAYPSREGALCTCPDFALRGLGTCKHLEATWIWLERNPDLPDVPRPPRAGPTPSWAEVERGQATLDPRTFTVRRWRAAGRILVGTTPTELGP